jgi:hypothetical protein
MNLGPGMPGKARNPTSARRFEAIDEEPRDQDGEASGSSLNAAPLSNEPEPGLSLPPQIPTGSSSHPLQQKKESENRDAPPKREKRPGHARVVLPCLPGIDPPTPVPPMRCESSHE